MKDQPRRETSPTPLRWAFVLDEHKHLLEPLAPVTLAHLHELTERPREQAEPHGEQADAEPHGDRSFLSPWRKRSMSREQIGRRLLQVDGGVAQLVVSGPLVPWVTFNWLTWEFNPTTGDYLAAVEYVAKRADITWLHAWIDSPGGTDYGTFQLADALWQLRQGQGQRAGAGTSCYSSEMAASAAYWIAAQHEHVMCSQIADIGSVGGYVLLFDWTKFDDEMGVKAELVRTGGEDSIKGDAAAYRVTEGLKKNVETRLEQSVAYFLDGVSRGRGFDRARVDQIPHGHLWLGNDALSLGLVDELHASREAAWARVLELSGAGERKPQAASVESEPDSEGDEMANRDENRQSRATQEPETAGEGRQALEEIRQLREELKEERAEKRALRAERMQAQAEREVESLMGELGERINLAMHEAGVTELAVSLRTGQGLEGGRNAYEVLRAVLEAIPEPRLAGREEIAGEEPYQKGEDRKTRASETKARAAAFGTLSEDDREFVDQFCDTEEITRLASKGLIEVEATA